jgi:hypothetical protein
VLPLPSALDTGSVIDRSGLLAAVSRIAAILPNDLASTNMNGPKLPFVAGLVAAVRPVIAAIRAERSILLAETSVCGTKPPLIIVNLLLQYL